MKPMSKSLLFYFHFVIFFPKPALRICELQSLVLLPTVVEACMYCVTEKQQQQQQQLPDIQAAWYRMFSGSTLRES